MSAELVKEWYHAGSSFRVVKVESGYLVEECHRDALGGERWDVILNTTDQSYNGIAAVLIAGIEDAIGSDAPF